MLPKTSLARQKLRGKLKVYAGPEHPHAAQQPKPFSITPSKVTA
jgi:large subunit ribosomal protein L13